MDTDEFQVPEHNDQGKEGELTQTFESNGYHQYPEKRNTKKSSALIGSGVISLIARFLSLIVGVGSYYLLLYCQLTIPNALRECFKHFPEILQSSTKSVADTLEDAIAKFSSNTTDAITPAHPIVDKVVTSLHNITATHYAIQTFNGMIISAVFFSLIYYAISSIYYNRNHIKPSKEMELSEKQFAHDSDESESGSGSEDSMFTKSDVHKESIVFGSMITSSVHAFLVVALGSVLHTRFFIPVSHVAVKDMLENKFTGISPLGSVHTTIAAGYFLWDLCISIWRYRIFGFSSLLHAITGILTFTALPFSKFGQYFISFCLLYEISTIPLNIMIYYRDFVKRDTLSNSAGLIFGISFIYIRIIRGYEVQKEAQKTTNDNYEFIFTEKDAERIISSNTTQGDIAKHIFGTKEEFHSKFKELLYWTYSGVNLSFWGLNIVWGWQVFLKILRGLSRLFFGSKKSNHHKQKTE